MVPKVFAQVPVHDEQHSGTLFDSPVVPYLERVTETPEMKGKKIRPTRSVRRPRLGAAGRERGD